MSSTRYHLLLLRALGSACSKYTKLDKALANPDVVVSLKFNNNSKLPDENGQLSSPQYLNLPNTIPCIHAGLKIFNQ